MIAKSCQFSHIAVDQTSGRASAEVVIRQVASENTF